MHVPALKNNVEAIRHHVEVTLARFPWVQMILFSELAVCGPVHTSPELLPGPSETALQEIAAKYKVWLIPGSMFEREGERIYNTASVIDPHGTVIRRYRKMFPFRPYEAGVDAGSEFCVFDVPHVGRFGLSICYDMWFPETTRTLTSMGAEVLLHPVLTGSIDRDVELSIARATAVQFQCYVFDINGLGAGGVGRSCIVDPAGTVLHQAAGVEESIAIEIDLDRVRRQRETGANGLGQVLKSFRDREVEFPVYDRSNGTESYLDTLGPLHMAKRGDRQSMAHSGSSYPLPAAGQEGGIGNVADSAQEGGKEASGNATAA